MRKFLEYLFKEWFRQVGEALLLAFLVTTFLFTTVGVVGSSMNPTLLNGERVFVPKYETWLVRFGLMQWQRGEVAIVKPPEGTPNAVARFPVLGFEFRAFFIKRIVALPGDEVSLREGVLYVNGQPLNELHITASLQPYPDSYPVVCYRDGRLTALITQQQVRFTPELLPDYLRPTLEMLVPPSEEELAKSRLGEHCFVGALKLRPGYYFVMGDNRTFGGSEDSRTFGPVPVTAIAGRANAVWWPLNRIRLLPVPEGFRALEN
ncbi:signal peptidase I [Meiothermus sp. QL-1]|uniref:signal peptidase I n=1 Tax=Meiothermus sp. QL-1 TaxID=2058095 RepID=UPI000E0A0078|nr:signal peptidase I [Meiothermus sp. QL-1]RDI94872.1 signal peptidase I [Meiothermus sp. QL-1]